MEVIDDVEMKRRIRRIWQVEFIWLADKKYTVLGVEEIRKFLEGSTLDRQVYVEHKNDCDDFALQLHAEAKRYFSGFDEYKYPVAFGECFAVKWSGWGMTHNGNICICDSGVYLIEPQTDALRKGEVGSDMILIVKI